jgi:hypothetical protein
VGDCAACDDGDPCTIDECTPTSCEHLVVASGPAPEQTQGDCVQIECQGGVAVEVAAEDDAPVSEACVTWSCDGATPVSTPVTRGNSCDEGGTFCDGAGLCVECIEDAHCGGTNTCGGGGEPGFCGCTPLSCDEAGLTCGTVFDGCGGLLQCDNGIADGVETDVDCGGASAACGKRCDAGFACLEAGDCFSGFCGGGLCSDAWSSTLSGNSNATANAVATSTQGRAAVVGDFVDSATFAGATLATTTSAGFLAILDPAGALVSVRTLDDGTSARDVAIDPAGNIVVVGARGPSPHVEKRDSTGKPLWTVPVTGSGVATSVAVDGQGHIHVIGELDGTVTMGQGSDTVTLSGSLDTFLVEFDTAGDIVGGRTFASQGVQKAVDVAVSSLGTVVVSADFAGTVDLGQPLDSGGDWDSYVVTLDAQLQAKAVRQLGGVGEQHVAGVAFDGSDRLFVTGSFGGELVFEEGASLLAQGDSDIFVARLDPGTLLRDWVQRFGDAQHQHAAALAGDVRGGVAIAGGFAGTIDFGGTVLNSAGGMDAFFATIDEHGNVTRARRFGDHNAQHADGVAMSAFGAVFVTGAFRGTVDFGQGPVTSVGTEDAFVAAF